MKWIPITTSIDLETGEIITKKIRDLEYQVIRTHKKVEKPPNTDGILIIRYTQECRKKPKQQSLWNT